MCFCEKYFWNIQITHFKRTFAWETALNLATVLMNNSYGNNRFEISQLY